MKSYSPAKKLSRTAARNALLLNQLATPGMGSIAARHWLAGLGQLAVFLAGFCIFAVWAFQQFNLALALWSGADPAPAGNGHPGVLGFSLAAIAWLWSLGTTFQGFTRNRPAAARKKAATASGLSMVLPDESMNWAPDCVLTMIAKSAAVSAASSVACVYRRSVA